MKSIDWLNVVGGVCALALAVFFVGGMAFLVGAIPLYIVIGIGMALMVWDIFVTNREIAGKRDQA